MNDSEMISTPAPHIGVDYLRSSSYEIIDGVILVDEDKFRFQIARNDIPCKRGIDGGRITKLQLLRNGDCAACFFRGWGTRPVDRRSKRAALRLIADFNELSTIPLGCWPIAVSALPLVE